MEGAAGVGAHEDGIDMEAFGFLQDHVGGGALDEEGGGVQAVLAEIDGHGFELLVRAGELVGDGEADAFGAGAVANEIGIGLGDVEEVQLGGEAAGPEAGFAQDGGGRSGQIQGGEQFHGGVSVLPAETLRRTRAAGKAGGGAGIFTTESAEFAERELDGIHRIDRMGRGATTNETNDANEGGGGAVPRSRNEYYGL